MQRPWLAPVVLIALAGCAVPFALPLSRMSYVEGVMPLMPRGGEAATNFIALQDAFGISNVGRPTSSNVHPRP